MAIIKFGAIVTDARGKLGGHYFNKAKGVSTIATKPNAPSQLFYAKNNKFAVLQRALGVWTSFSYANKQKFIVFAKEQRLTNRFGDETTISGRAMAVKMISARYVAGLSFSSTFYLSTILSGVSAFGNPNSQFLVNILNAGVQTDIVVRWYIGQRDNINADATKFRFLHSQVIPAGNSSLNVNSLLTVDQRQRAIANTLFVEVREINSVGWLGTPTFVVWNRGILIN